MGIHIKNGIKYTGSGKEPDNTSIVTDSNDKLKLNTEFEDAGDRENISSGDSISTIFGKIKKFFADLKSIAFTGSYSDLDGAPANLSDFTNDVGYITSYTETDPTVSDWAKALTKPSYTWTEITDKPSFAVVATSGDYRDLSNTPTIPTVPTNVSAFTNDSGYITSSGSAHPIFENGTWYVVGDDVYIGDHNVGGGLGLLGATGNTRLDFCQYGNSGNYKSITFDGSTLYLNGNCDYATSAGSAPANGGTATYSNYVNSLGSLTPKSGRDAYHSGIYTYTSYTDTNTPTYYSCTIGFGNGIGGSAELCAGWISRSGLWYRTIRDYADSWTAWAQIITSDNIGSQSVNYATSAGSASTLSSFSSLFDTYEANNVSSISFDMSKYDTSGFPSLFVAECGNWNSPSCAGCIGVFHPCWKGAQIIAQAGYSTFNLLFNTADYILTVQASASVSYFRVRVFKF